MEKFKPKPEDSPVPRIEELESDIRNLLNPKIGKEHWSESWKNHQFLEQFPNIAQLLLYKEYPEQDRKRIFELAFTSFMELYLTTQSFHLTGSMFNLNKGLLPMWQRSATQGKRPNTESLITIEVGSLVGLGLRLQDKEFARNLIMEDYDRLKAANKFDTKARNFRNNIVRLMTEKNLFREWVKENHIDQKYDFDWDIEIPELLLRLSPFHRKSTSIRHLPNNLPTEFKSDLKIFPPMVINVLSTHALEYAQNLSLGYSIKDLRDFIIRFEELNPDHFRDRPELFDEVKFNIGEISKIISNPN